MAKVLLTGGSGFIASHVLKTLLERGYSVITTVRSADKGDKLLAAYENTPKEKLSYVIVKDIAAEGAFDQAVQSDPPFEYVIHTASPFPAAVVESAKDLLDPAINGTTGVLKAIKLHAPTVKRVVITSSFAAIMNPKSPPKVYDESSWNSVTIDEAVADPSFAYRASKTFAEKAAWDFVANEKPGFDIATMNPPLVYGPVIHHLQNLTALNTSNQRIRNFAQGQILTNELPPTGTFIWVDVRDLALAHVKALEVPEAGGKRFFMTAGYCSNKGIVDAIRETHPELSSKLPESPIDDFPKDCYGYDNTRAKSILGIDFRTVKECIGDTVTSLLKLDN